MTSPSPNPFALPSRPHIDHLRRQARDLLRAWRAGDPAALARTADYHLPEPLRLAGAQLVIAREHSFDSWPRLVAAVEQQRAQALSDAEFVERVLALALGRGYASPQPARALALAGTRSLRSGPLATVVALVLGDLPAVQRSLGDVQTLLAPWDAPALVYAAFSSLARLPEHQPRLVQTVQWLLEQGADPNAGLHEPAFPEHPLPALFGAVARASCLATTEALLRAGADPNDNESLYHATEQTDRRLLAALVQAGARWNGTNALLRQLDHDDLDGLRQALDLGADPNEASPDGVPPLHHALQRGRGLPFLQLMVERGADPLARDTHGHTAALMAAHSGDTQTLAWLISQGVPSPVAEPAQAFLAACAAGDEASARAYVAQHPDAVATLDPIGLRLLPDQAQRGRLDAVRLMLSLGWPVATRGDWDASALNQAAFRGDAAMVQQLLAHGARWHEPNGFGGNALGSCLHAACHQPDAAGDYAAVLALLLDDGAPPPTNLDDLPEPLQDLLLSPRAAPGSAATTSAAP